MVVAQRYAKPPAYIRMPCRVDVPLRAGKLDRTDVGQRRRLDTASRATGTENAPVESRVVRGDEIGTIKPGPEGRPELSEGWCATDVFPCESMGSGKREYRRRRPDESAQSNFTDPESRIMKTNTEGFQQCYNAQMVVEGDNQLVVAVEVSDNASDQGQLLPMIDTAAEVRGETPEQVLADAGYGNERDLNELENRGMDAYVALGREGKAVAKVDPEALSWTGPHVGKDGERGWAQTVCTAKVVVRGAQRLDQGGDGISTIQLPGPREGPG